MIQVDCRGRWCPAVGACLVMLFVLLGCVTNPAPHAAPLVARQQAAVDPQSEKDEIFSLLAYAVVQRDWQEAGRKDRGYNIGSVLVDPNGCVAYWGLNSVYLTKNKTQHGEVRLMTCYLGRNPQAPGNNLKDYTVYTTLEPCAMCSGMMVLQSVRRTVYGQGDPCFGDALERLAFDGEHCGGYPPYPRPVQSVASTLGLRGRLETLYKEYCGGQVSCSSSNCSITDFLATAGAKQVYDEALAALRSYQPRFPENKPVLAAAQRFYDSPLHVAPTASCPELEPPSCPLPGPPPGR
jgi:tRNA(adenine34) deaminase